MSLAFPLFALLVGVLLARKVYKLRGLIADYRVRLDVANAELETANISYKALLARANGLAEDRAKANALVSHVETYLGKMGTEVQELLNRHLLARRALERILSYPETEGGNYTRALKDIAGEALETLGLTMTGTVEVLAQRMVPTGEEVNTTAVQLLDAAGGVASVNENRPMKPVDLSGQAARIREQLKATSSRLHIVVEGAKPGQCRGCGGPEESPGVDVVREYPKSETETAAPVVPTASQPE